MCPAIYLNYSMRMRRPIVPIKHWVCRWCVKERMNIYKQIYSEEYLNTLYGIWIHNNLQIRYHHDTLNALFENGVKIPTSEISQIVRHHYMDPDGNDPSYMNVIGLLSHNYLIAIHHLLQVGCLTIDDIMAGFHRCVRPLCCNRDVFERLIFNIISPREAYRYCLNYYCGLKVYCEIHGINVHERYPIISNILKRKGYSRNKEYSLPEILHMIVSKN